MSPIVFTVHWLASLERIHLISSISNDRVFYDNFWLEK